MSRSWDKAPWRPSLGRRLYDDAVLRLSGEAIRARITFADLIEPVEEAFKDYSRRSAERR